MGIFDGIRGVAKPMTPFDPAEYTTRATAAPSNVHRPLVASGKRIDLRNQDDIAELRYRVYAEWQNDAWAYYDAIGEIKYGFGMLAAVLSRIRIYSSLNLDPDSIPISTLNYRRRAVDLTAEEHDRDEKREMTPPEGITDDVMKAAERLVKDLTYGPGGLSGFLRDYALNMSVAGECYLVQIKGDWHIKSSNELVVDAGGNILLRSQRTSANNGQVSSTGSVLGDVTLPKNTKIVRIWRGHPRYSQEPESSMLGLREACDELITLQRMIRTVARSNMNAGILYIPEGLIAAGASVSDDLAAEQEEDEALIKTLYDNLVASVVDETNAGTVFPTVLTGPAEAGKALQYIQINREADRFLTERCDRTLERILQGIDMPKDFVTGLANIRYTNARSIDESLYKSHIEPLVLMLVDALTTAYLWPALKKDFPHLTREDLSFLGVWYDPSEIVTKANPAESADKGFDNYSLSADSWRQAHGFSDTDAPGEEEIAVRMLQKATLPPDLISSLFSYVFPNITERQRAAALGASPIEFPESAAKMLYGKDGATDTGAPMDPDASTGSTEEPDFSQFIVTDEEEEAMAASAAVPDLDDVLIASGMKCLYTTPYDGNEMQERYRAIAEAAVRSGQSHQKEFRTANLVPTQPKERSRSNGTGAGAKDLPPIVIQHEGKDYLLDGHHRAGRRRKIMAAYVDVDNLKTTTGHAV